MTTTATRVMTPATSVTMTSVELMPRISPNSSA